jgi:hypothetical protein
MKTDENASGQTPKVAEPRTLKDEKSNPDYSLVQPLPKPDPTLRNYVEASEEVESDNLSSDS